MRSPKKPRRRKPVAKANRRSTPQPQSEPIESVEPLFEPELLAAAHANPEFADTTVISRDVAESTNIDAAVALDEPVAAVAAQAEAPEIIATRVVARQPTNDVPAVKATSQPELATAHDAEAEATELAAAPARAAADERAPRRGGVLSAVRMAASALGKAKELKHKLDDALAAHPIEHRARAAADTQALVKDNELAHGTNALEVVDHEHALAPVARSEHVDTHVGPSERDIEIDMHVSANERAIERDLQLRASANAVTHVASDEVPHHVLTAGGSVYEPEPEPRVDKTVAKGLAHEREALAEAHHLVDKLQGDHEPVENKKLAAEKAREGDPTVDRHAGARDIDAAYQHEVVAKAKELQHELEHHLESEALDREQPQSSNDHANENKRAKIAEVEPVPTTNEEIHRERALFVGGAVWVVGGLAAVVLGILALAGVGRPFVLVEVAVLAAAVSILLSALANGARVLARHDVHEQQEDHARDVDDAVAQPPALHARASDRAVELHR